MRFLFHINFLIKRIAIIKIVIINVINDSRDALFLSISNFLTCILAGFVVFIYMGALANATNIAIENVVQGGQGLVYIVYPYAATTIEGGPIWAIMFFIMMLALGMGTKFLSNKTIF